MSGNSFGRHFIVTTFGESHGPALGCIIDGCPPGMPLSVQDIQPDLDRRKPGSSKYTTQRREKDQVKILSGVFEGQTTGTPIGLLIENTDQRSKDYGTIQHQFRPGHGDFTYWHKYGIRDHRGGGRASARETAMRVAAGAIAKKYLAQHCGLKIRGYLAQMGDIVLNFDHWDAVSQNPFFCPNTAQIAQLEEKITQLRRAGDSIGARLTLIAEHMPIGLGEPVFDKLDADIAHAMMGINAVKGVEIGDGFGVITQTGSQHRDLMDQSGFLSNHSGGTLAGISSGQDLIVHIALKPTSSLIQAGKSLDTSNNEVDVVTKGRHDPCVGFRAVPIAEAMIALVLMDHLLRHRAQCS